MALLAPWTPVNLAPIAFGPAAASVIFHPAPLSLGGFGQGTQILLVSNFCQTVVLRRPYRLLLTQFQWLLCEHPFLRDYVSLCLAEARPRF